MPDQSMLKIVAQPPFHSRKPRQLTAYMTCLSGVCSIVLDALICRALGLLRVAKLQRISHNDTGLLSA